MGEYEDKFVKKVNEFVENYPTIISQVESGLHDLYDITDYPNADEVRKKFTMQMTTTPVPSSGDFRVDINKKELDKIKKELDEQMLEANVAAEKDQFARLYTALAKTTLALKDPSKIFRNSLILNLEEICKKIPLMNINDNKKLNDIATTTLNGCEDIDFKELRKNPVYRENEAINFESLLKQVELEYESINPNAEDAEGKK